MTDDEKKLVDTVNRKRAERQEIRDLKIKVEQLEKITHELFERLK